MTFGIYILNNISTVCRTSKVITDIVQYLAKKKKKKKSLAFLFDFEYHKTKTK